MAKNSLPGSMDLLLDTMCNTFGGVMFIAIALSLALFAGQIKPVTAPPEADESAKLEKVQSEQRQLQAEKAKLEQELSQLQQKVSRESGNIPPQAAEVSALETQTKKISRQVADTSQQLRSATAETADLERRNAALEQKNRENKQELSEKHRQIKADHQILHSHIETLEKTLNSLPVKKLHFALHENTRRRPYFAIVKTGELFRAGNADVSNDEVMIKRDKNIIRLFPRRGRLLSMITDANISTVLGFDKSRYFFWAIVHPDSLAEFVALRRLLRRHGYQVNWYVERNPILYLVRNASYGASF